MSKIFEAVQAMSGQGNCITIPAPYIDFFEDDQQAHALGAVLNQLVFWSGKSSLDDGWFYKEHSELASEIRGVSDDQIQRLVNKICTRWLPGIVEKAQRQVNGTKKTHYRLHGEALINAIFPSVLDSAESRNLKREVAEPIPQNRGTHSAESRNLSREVAEPILYTDHYTDDHLQKKNTSGQPPSAADRDGDFSEEIHITDQAILVLKHLNLMTGAKYTTAKSTLENIRARIVDGNTVDDLKLVVEYLADRWLGTEWAKHLNPVAMFRPEKFSGNLLAAQAWNSAGRKSAQKSETVNTAERDDAFKRLIQQRGKPKDATEELALKKGAGLGSRNLVMAMSLWKGIWAEAVREASAQQSQRSA